MDLTAEQRRDLVLAYYRRGWSASDACTHAYCNSIRITRSEYLEILLAYVRERDPAPKLGRRRPK